MWHVKAYTQCHTPLKNMPNALRNTLKLKEMLVEKPHIPPSSPDLSSLPCCRAAYASQCLRVKCARPVSFFLLAIFPSTPVHCHALVCCKNHPNNFSLDGLRALQRDGSSGGVSHMPSHRAPFKTAYYSPGAAGLPASEMWGQTYAVLKYLNISNNNKCPQIFFF